MIRRDSINLQMGGATALIGSELLTFIRFIGEMTASIFGALRHPGKVRRKETLYYLNVCGADGLPITILICFLAGKIIGYQAAVQMRKYGAEGFLPGLVGCTVVR